MEYLFILGRNPELSKQEIFSFFRKENVQILNSEQIKNSLLLELEKLIEKGVIDKLGGTIAIGEVIARGSIKEIIAEIKKEEIYSGIKNKINYVLWNFSDEDAIGMVSDSLKERFKYENIKASEKNSSSNFIDEQYFLFGRDKEKCFGKIIEKCDYEKIEERDMEKPARRPELSISPRLAKIMINLSGIKSGEKLIDPFCGIGVILYEALLQNIKVIGMDIDKNAIEGARQNLAFGKFSKENYELINADSRKIKVETGGVIVTEPDLGQLLVKMPSKEKAEKIMGDFENLIISVLNNLKSRISGRIVFTAPFIKALNGRISCDKDKILNKTRLKLAISFPIRDYRENSIVGREIYVLCNS